MNTFKTFSQVPLKKNINILVIDDDEDDYILTCSQISGMANGFACSVSWSSNYKHALNEICKATHDVYFVDFRLGEKTGLDLINEAIGNGCEEPMVLLTGVGTQEIDILAMEAGAVDYLVKSEMTPEKLERSIRYALGRYEFIKALKVNEQKFRNIFERSKDSVFIGDNELNFKDVNEATSIIFGYSKKEFLQLTLYDMIFDESDKTLIRELLESKKEVTDMETILCTKSKEKINCILSMTVEKDDREGTYIQGILHDITTLKNAVYFFF
ncbi:MAG: PAS domain S-box protein, partial [Chitinophagaceae bacterium]